MNIVIATLHVRRSAQAVPLAAGCLAASLPIERRQNTRLVDFFPDQSIDEMTAEILADNPALVVCPIYVWNRPEIIALTRTLRQRKADLHLVVGGPEASGDHSRLAAAAPWLIVARGEGETVFPQLVEALSGSAPLESVPGLTWCRDGNIMTTPPPSESQPGSALPSPWLEKTLDPADRDGVLWEISRGCRFSCDYCFDARGQEGVRKLDWTRLEEELGLFAAAGVSQVWVLDSTFNFPPTRGKALLTLLRDKAPHIHYHIEAKAEFLNRDMVSLLAGLSCSVQIGLQSGNPEALKAVHRTFDLEHFSQQIQLLHAEGVVYGFDLIFGLPNDDYPHLRKSLDWALQLGPNHVHMFPLAVLPGTRLADQRQKYALEAQPEPPYEILRSASWSPVDLAKSRRLAAAVDLFYNTGRAVAFFQSLLKLLGDSPSDFLEDFSAWLETSQQITCDPAQLAAVSAAQVLRMQQDYISQRLRQHGKPHLLSAMLDLLNYHFHYAETLLDAPVVPPKTPLPSGDALWFTTWRIPPQVRLVSFAYEIVDVMDMEDFDPETFAELFRPVGSVGMFIRRNDDVFCESLTEDFHTLMRNCDGTKTPAQIFKGSLSRQAAEEMVSFAVAEGLLQRSDIPSPGKRGHQDIRRPLDSVAGSEVAPR